MNYKDQVAFPLPPEPIEMGRRGLTKREIFAMAAMHGMLTNPVLYELLQKIPGDQQIAYLNNAAIEQADDMLTRLEYEQEKK